MNTETLESTPACVVRRMRLAPGEASHWHTDPCRRYTVVLGGDRLAIEFQGATEPEEFEAYAGLSGWDEPESRVHRAVNTGATDYVEIVTFMRPAALKDVQPIHPA